MNKIEIAMKIIEHSNNVIMSWFEDTVKPEEQIDNMPEGEKKNICKECIKWYSEMGEYWVDDINRIIRNLQWGGKLVERIVTFENTMPESQRIGDF